MKRIAFIVNPTAGRGHAGRRLDEIKKSMLGQTTIASTFCLTSQRGHAYEIALKSIDEGYDCVVAVGGDGTLHEVVNAFLAHPGHTTYLGLIPFGTGNDFARAVGLQGPLQHFLDTVVSGTLHPIDIGTITSKSLPTPRHFLVAAGMGFVAQTAKTVNDGIKNLTGPAAYIAGALATLKHFVPEYIKLCIDGKLVFEGESTLVSVSNVATTGGGIKIMPSAYPDDGFLDICLVSKVSRARIAVMLPRAFAGTHGSDQAVTMFRGKTVDIVSLSESPLWIDGEIIGNTPANFTIVPGALKMMLPKSWCETRESK